MSKKLLIHQYLSKTGKFESKEEIIDALHAGKVKINGEVITNKQFQFNPNNSEVTYRGESLSDIQNLYVVMNKPEGYVCARFNKPQEEGKRPRKSAFDLLKFLNLSPRIEATLFTVGRLEDDTAGLLLFTNDTEFRDKITKAKNPVQSVFHVRILRPLSDAQHRALKAGVNIEIEENAKKSQFHSKPTKIEVGVDDRCNLVLTIEEQKKDQIRKMLAAIGNEVIELKRISIGGLTLKSLRLPIGICDKVDKRVLNEILDIETERKFYLKDL